MPYPPAGNHELCPACDHRTLHMRHMYETCPVCQWVDANDDIDGYISGGGNLCQLPEARKTYREIGVYHVHYLNRVLSPEARAKYEFVRRYAFAEHPPAVNDDEDDFELDEDDESA